MLLCTPEDIEARLGRPLSDEEAARVEAVIADVSAVLLASAPRIPRTPPTPPAVLAVACELVTGRLSDGPGGGVLQESLGGYSVTYARDSGSGGLSEAHLEALAPWRRRGIAVVRVDPGAAEVVGR